MSDTTKDMASNLREKTVLEILEKMDAMLELANPKNKNAGDRQKGIREFEDERKFLNSQRIQGILDPQFLEGIDEAFKQVKEGNGAVYNGLVSTLYEEQCRLVYSIFKNGDKKVAEKFIKNRVDRKGIKYAKDMEKCQLLTHILTAYQRGKLEGNRDNLNDFLASFSLVVEQKFSGKFGSPKQEDMNLNQALRAVFNGGFSLPSEDELSQNQKRDFYTPVYLAHLANKNKQPCENESYDNLKNMPFFKALQAAGIKFQKDAIKDALRERQIPSGIAEKLNVNDIGKILFDTYSEEDYDKERGSALSFEEVDLVGKPSEYSEMRKNFLQDVILQPDVSEQIRSDLENKGVDREYIDYWFESVREDGVINPSLQGGKFKKPIPYFSIHHKHPINSAGGLEAPQTVNNIHNFVLIPQIGDDFLLHGMFHIIDKPLYLEENGKIYRTPVQKGLNLRLTEVLTNLPPQGMPKNQRLVYYGGFGETQQVVAKIPEKYPNTMREKPVEEKVKPRRKRISRDSVSL